MYRKNQAVLIAKDNSIHDGKIGYFQFFAGKENDIAVITESRTEENVRVRVYSIGAINIIGSSEQNN